MNSHLILQALWLVAPVVVAGIVHIVVIKTNTFQVLACSPLDMGRTFRRRRVFGKNKSLRGAVVMPLATIAFTLLQAGLVSRFAWARDLGFADFPSVPPILWGALLGVGYVVGELPNSFLKRQLDVPPGASAPGLKGAVFWFLDQVDSLIGILLLLCLVWVPPLSVAVAMVALTLVLHPAASLLMLTLKLKSRIG